MDTVPSRVAVKWVEDTMMTGMDSNERPIVIGSSKYEDMQWRGVKASDLLLLAAASCSMYDVITILTKQREPVERLDVICSGEQMQEAPYKFVALHLKYIVKGNVDPKKLERAIALSEDKYCSVLNTLKPQVEVTNEYHFVE